MKKLQKTIAAAALGMLCMAGTAQATVALNISGVSDKVAALDWTVGSSYAQGGNSLTVPTPIPGFGEVFTISSFPVYFQAQLGSFNRSNPADPVINTPALNNSYYITVVAGYYESGTVLHHTTGPGATPAGSSASFAFDSSQPSFVNIYKTLVAPNNLTGTGFAPTVAADPNFTLLFKGHIVDTPTTPFSGGFTSVDNFIPSPTNLDQNANGDQWSGQKSTSGSGSTALTAQADYFDPTFFIDPIILATFDINSNTSNKLPFQEGDPSKLFYNDFDGDGVFSTFGSPGTLGVNNGAANGTGTGNIEFQTDANSSFDAEIVPEPSTFVLSGLGLLLAGGFLRRRRNS